MPAAVDTLSRSERGVPKASLSMLSPDVWLAERPRGTGEPISLASTSSLSPSLALARLGACSLCGAVSALHAQALSLRLGRSEVRHQLRCGALLSGFPAACAAQSVRCTRQKAPELQALLAKLCASTLLSPLLTIAKSGSLQPVRQSVQGSSKLLSFKLSQPADSEELLRAADCAVRLWQLVSRAAS